MLEAVEEWGVGVGGDFSGEDECPKGKSAEGAFLSSYFHLFLSPPVTLLYTLSLSLSSASCLILSFSHSNPTSRSLCPGRYLDIIGLRDDSEAPPQLPVGWF